MAEARRYSCCERAITRARLSEIAPTLDDLAWLFGMSRRWATELRKRGVLTEGAPLPELVQRMAAYKPEARTAARRGRSSKR